LIVIQKKKKDFSLEKVNFQMEPGQLLIVIGAVGSGKTTLLMGSLNEIYLAEGTVRMNGKVGFACEDPWIITGTIRENILMGQRKDKEWYDKVI
jgi:ATP-binding cassette subfamily C (CFTR/MRP) protein 4